MYVSCSYIPRELSNSNSFSVILLDSVSMISGLTIMVCLGWVEDLGDWIEWETLKSLFFTKASSLRPDEACVT